MPSRHPRNRRGARTAPKQFGFMLVETAPTTGHLYTDDSDWSSNEGSDDGNVTGGGQNMRMDFGTEFADCSSDGSPAA